MSDVDFADILNPLNELMEQFPAFVLLNSLIFDNVIKELSIFHVLHHQH